MALQTALATDRGKGKIPDTLLLLEHPVTYTLGRRGAEANLLVPLETLARMGIPVHRSDRGGDVTVHGPGQLVGYPVLALGPAELDPVHYLRDLERVLIRALAAFGIEAGREPGLTGVWVDGAKIAALGIRVDARGVSSHGFALNVTTDLDIYEAIVPCGIKDRAVTSMARVTGGAIPVATVAREVVRAFGRVFRRRVSEALPAGRRGIFLAAGGPRSHMI